MLHLAAARVTSLDLDLQTAGHVTIPDREPEIAAHVASIDRGLKAAAEQVGPVLVLALWAEHAHGLLPILGHVQEAWAHLPG